MSAVSHWLLGYFTLLYPYFLSSCSISYWEWVIEIFNSNCWIIYFLFQYCQFLLQVFWGSVFRCVYFNFLKHLPEVVTIFHHEMSLFFSLVICLVSKSILCHNELRYSILLWYCCHGIFLFPSLYFQTLCIFASKLCPL